jgi:quercetin dioxygenase-like cupin family protein
MKIIKVDQVRKKPITSSFFTGGKVTRQTLVGPDVGHSLDAAMVNFSQGARTKFHTHTSDQIIIVSAGKGIVATEQEERTISPGDIIFFPAGEKHWHGATKASDFSHIYIVASGSKMTQLED